MAVRSTNTYQEGLQLLIQDVASMMLLPDANPEFLFQLQNALIQQASAPAGGQAPAAPPVPGNAMSLPDMAGMGAAPAGPPLAMPGGGPMPGSAPLPPSPAADELRRMLQ